MILIDTDQKLTYKFDKLMTVTGTLTKLEEVAKLLNVKIDYKILAEENNIPNTYYNSEHDGPIKVNNMSIEHLRYALLKQLRNYYAKENFKDLKDFDFIKHLEDPKLQDSEIDMLYKELIKRIG